MRVRIKELEAVTYLLKNDLEFIDMPSVSVRGRIDRAVRSIKDAVSDLKLANEEIEEQGRRGG